MIRRRGVTLIEVLAAIFIMGIGLLALLTLFPLGALSMARSVRDNNASNAGAAALGTAQAFDLRNDPNVLTAFQSAPGSTVTINGMPQFIQGAAQLPNGPGYPVYVDPFYAVLGSSNIGFNYQATNPNPLLSPGITRIAPAFNGCNKSSLANRFFTYFDDLTFGDNGMPLDPSVPTQNPAGVATNSLDRPGRYTWAYMLRPGRRGAGQFAGNASFNEEPICEMSVVIYLNRQTNTISGENLFILSAQANTGTTSVTFNYTTPPDLRVGDWVLDTTYDPLPTAASPTSGSVHGYFYKIVDFTDSGSSLTLTLETPLRMPMNQLVHMQNVFDVQERGIGAKP